MYHQLSLNENQKEILKEIRDASYETLSGRDKNGIPYLKHIFDLHFKIFGETCSNCPSKISGYIHKLKSINNSTKMKNTKSDFQLNEGVIIPVTGTSEVYSQHNLTDENAIKLLSENPNRKSLFRTLPENVDELIEAYVSIIEVNQDDAQDDNNDNQDGNQNDDDDDENNQNQDDAQDDNNLVSLGDDKVTIEEALSLLELINIKTKATTVVGIEKKISELSEESKTELQNLVAELVTKQ